MKLSAEQFADVAASFDPAAAPREGHERRRASRLELEAHVTVRVLTDGLLADPKSFRVYDFSSRGIAILSPNPLPQGTQFVVDFQRRTGGCVSMLCTVRHTRPIKPQCFKIGAEFTCVVGEHPGTQPATAAVEAELSRIRESMLG